MHWVPQQFGAFPKAVQWSDNRTREKVLKNLEKKKKRKYKGHTFLKSRHWNDLELWLFVSYNFFTAGSSLTTPELLYNKLEIDDVIIKSLQINQSP